MRRSRCGGEVRRSRCGGAGTEEAERSEEGWRGDPEERVALVEPEVGDVVGEAGSERDVRQVRLEREQQDVDYQDSGDGTREEAARQGVVLLRKLGEVVEAAGCVRRAG